MREAIAFVPLAALTLSLMSTVAAFFFYWTGSVRKRYAAERDFDHLRRNQEHIVQLLITLDDDVSDLRVELIRMGATFHETKKSPRSEGG